MPSVNSTKSGAFLTFLTDMMPCQMPRTVVLTLLYTAKRRIMYHARMQTAMPQTAVTAYPVAEKPDRMVLMLVPVRSKNVVKTWNWNTIVSSVISIMSAESMARSVTTVPRAFGNDTPS